VLGYLAIEDAIPVDVLNLEGAPVPVMFKEALSLAKPTAGSGRNKRVIVHRTHGVEFTLFL
jgi:hypothetical protein